MWEEDSEQWIGLLGLRVAGCGTYFVEKRRKRYEGKKRGEERGEEGREERR